MANPDGTELRDWHEDPGVVAMERLRDGDESAFSELFGKYREMVVRFAYGFLHAQDWAEDVAQNTFLRLYQARERYEPRARFTTYLLRIAKNLCLNELRRRDVFARVEPRRSPGGEEVAFENLRADSASLGPTACLARREAANEVMRVLERLPSRQRSALWLTRVEGFSYQDVAERMHGSRGAVKSLVCRAAATLRSDLHGIL